MMNLWDALSNARPSAYGQIAASCGAYRVSLAASDDKFRISTQGLTHWSGEDSQALIDQLAQRNLPIETGWDPE